MLKIIMVGIAGVALGASAMSYINFTNNQSTEEKYAYLQRDVKQLTTEISTLKNEIRQLASASVNQNIAMGSTTAKKSTANPNKYHNSLTSDKARLAMLEQRKRKVKEKARKKHLGTSMATN